MTYQVTISPRGRGNSMMFRAVHAKNADQAHEWARRQLCHWKHDPKYYHIRVREAKR